MKDDKIDIIEIRPKRGHEHVYPWNVVPMSTEIMAIVPGADPKQLHGIYMKNIADRIHTIFAVIPNGVFLPVPASHYKP